MIWNDPDIGIKWPVAAEQVILSDKDKSPAPPARPAGAVRCLTAARSSSPAAPASSPRPWPTPPGVMRVGRPEFDFDQPDTIEAAFRAAAPRLVVNAAAYTAVDAAETDAEAAYRANARRAGDSGAAVRRGRHPADPRLHRLRVRRHQTDPLHRNRPGRPARRLRRQQARRRGSRHGAGAKAIILRTAWVYAADRQELRPHHADRRQDPRPADRRGRSAWLPDRRRTTSPTPSWRSSPASTATGWQPAYQRHFPCRRHRRDNLAWPRRRHLRGSRAATAPSARGAPIATADWPTPAKRPANSRLDCTRLHDVFGITLPHWRDSLARTDRRDLRHRAAQAGSGGPSSGDRQCRGSSKSCCSSRRF